ncbi:hydroxyacylglutathione hydrolase [Gammaproteobacteria bacterium]|jgi:hydroxyacylglutathione hydrolase|nr:hydroxyacylglutathione hydrolase [Gammaproteobacteria bacterium]
MKIQYIKAYTDNYIWLIRTNEGNLVIDPGESKPVESFTSQEGIQINDILLTHHHYDHVGGVLDLKKNILGKVVGPNNSQINGIDHHVVDGETVQSCGLEFSVIEIPGHTLDHIAYFINDGYQPILFCGDTLFSAGCGRVFEGTHKQMYESLMKLRELPENTLVYCAHEYTVNNLKFALEVEPNNEDIVQHLTACEEKINDGEITLPSSIDTELKINPFMRCGHKDLRRSIANKDIDAEHDSDIKIFGHLRSWKDSF